MKKGVAIAVETVIIVAIAVIVLAAVLMFFTTSFNPSADRIKLEQRKADLCGRYASAEPDCKAQPTGTLANELKDTCGKLGLPTNPQLCCSTYCPKNPRCEEQKEAGFKFDCLLKDTCNSGNGEIKQEFACDNAEHKCCKRRL